jgi:hypothetical protein
MIELIILSCVIVILVIYITYSNYKYYNSYLDGYYTGEPDFLDDADLTEFCLYLNSGDGYILMANADGDIIENQKITYKISFNFYSSTFTIKFDEMEILPKSLTLKVNPASGFLSLHDDKKTYAILIKDLFKSSLL